MRKSRVLYVLGLTLTLLVSSQLRHQLAISAELNGFQIHTQDKSVNITLYSDQPVAYNTERRDHQLTIILPEAKLSKKLMDEGLPVVIDDKNRFIGRAVLSSDGKVKIIIPNLPAEGYAVSIHQQLGRIGLPRDLNSSTAEEGGVKKIRKEIQVKSVHGKEPLKPVVTDSVLKPRSPIKTNSKQAFEQIISRLPTSSVAKQIPLRPVSMQNTANAGKLLPPRAILDKFNSPSPMTLSAVELNSTNPSGKRPGTIWNPYVVKVDPTPKEQKEADTTTDSNSAAEIYSHNESKPQASSQPAFDPYSYLHSLNHEPDLSIPTPPSFNFPNIMPGNFQSSHPNLPAAAQKDISPDGSSPEQSTDVINGVVRSEVQPAVKTETSTATKKITHSRHKTLRFIPEPFRSLLRPLFAGVHVNWIWFAVGLCLSGVGLFCLLGSALVGRLLFSRNLGFITVPQPMPAQIPDIELIQKSIQSPSLQVPTQLNKRRPIRNGLGFEDVALVNALDYTHRSTSTMSDAVRHNPFRERFSSRAHVRPRMAKARK